MEYRARLHRARAGRVVGAYGNTPVLQKVEADE